MTTAPLSPYDKTGLIDFANSLINSGFTLFASSGTVLEPQTNGLPIIGAGKYTNFLNILGVEENIQPGVSILDSASIEAANSAGITMVFTGVHHSGSLVTNKNQVSIQ